MIFESLLPTHNGNRTGIKMNPRYITVHETANTSTGANAKMHDRYLRNGAGGRSVSWHYTVDDSDVIQHLPDNEVGWHAGDGANGTGNRQSIGIEICVNRDGDFQKAVENAQRLIHVLMKKHDISVDCVVPHKHWTGKNCPTNLLKQWNSFKNGLKDNRTPIEVGFEKIQEVENMTLKKGSKGSEVKKLQQNLMKLGYDLPKFGADGHYGNETQKAVRQFQKANGLKVDGLAGKNTKAKINELLKKKPSTTFTLGGKKYEIREL